MAAAIGLVLFGLGIYDLVSNGERAAAFNVALVVGGFLEIGLGWLALHRLRGAWAFLLSLNGTGLLIFLFGAGKVRAAFDVHLVLGFAPALLFGVVTALLALGADEY